MIERVIAGQDCHFRRFFAEVVRNRADLRVSTAENLPYPGYYRMKGFGIFSEVIMENFFAGFHNSLQRDDLMQAHRVTTFLHYVVIPEVVVDLIKEDMKVDWETALAIMGERTGVGEYFMETLMKTSLMTMISIKLWSMYHRVLCIDKMIVCPGY